MVTTTTHPVRVPRSKLVQEGQLEGAIRLAQANTQSSGPVIVLLDADDDCPAVLGPQLKSSALAVSQEAAVSVVLARREFETWFLAAARSIAGLRGLRDGLVRRQIQKKSGELKSACAGTWLRAGLIRLPSIKPLSSQL